MVGEWHGGKGRKPASHRIGGCQESGKTRKSRKPASHRIGSQESGVGVGGEQEV